MLHVTCQGVLFDCDGVLVDSDASVASAWARWARDLELDPASVTDLVHGRRSADTVAILVPAERRREELARIDRYEMEDAAGVRAVDGSLELLKSMPRGRWAVVTSGRSELAIARLRAAGLPVPGVLISADDVAKGKPDPEGYVTASQRLGISPASSAVVEDAPSGIEAARAAGAGAVVGVGPRAEKSAPDVVVNDLRSLRWVGTGLEVTA
jgi:mannitol-1-/sugar-/sorbitol-6-phosphatase